jgi:DNA-binding MarR family transcriptional regulator
VSMLSLTESGTQAVQATRQHRQHRLKELLEDWSEDDVESFASLLEQFNTSIDRLTAADNAASGPRPS